MKLTGEQRVLMLLSMIPYYRERQYSGNYYDIDDLADIYEAIEGAELTARQREVVELLFIRDLVQEDAARLLGISQQAVDKHKNKAIKRITEAYEKGRAKDDYYRA